LSAQNGCGVCFAAAAAAAAAAVVGRLVFKHHGVVGACRMNGGAVRAICRAYYYFM
jgi:hypothetical protein